MSLPTEQDGVVNLTVYYLLRLSGFDPQTHDMTTDFRTGVRGPVSNLIRDLNQTSMKPVQKAGRIREVSSAIADHFNKQGFSQPNGPATSEAVEGVLREHLSSHVRMPVSLSVVANK